MICKRCHTTWNDSKLRIGQASCLCAAQVDALIAGEGGCPQCSRPAPLTPWTNPCPTCGAPALQGDIKYNGARKECPACQEPDYITAEYIETFEEAHRVLSRYKEANNVAVSSLP